MPNKRVYIFLNKELSDPQKIVQSSHLALESAREFQIEHHPSIIVLGIVRSNLMDIEKYLKAKNIKFVNFFEPDINEVTGLATQPLDTVTSKLLQHFPMIKIKDFKGDCQ